MRKCTGCGVLKGKGHFYGDNKKCNQCNNKEGMTEEQIKEWNEKYKIVRSFPRSVEEAIG